jgi:hypothetical protein
MTRYGRHSTIQHSLLGLSADETREFLRLEKLFSTPPNGSKRGWSPTDERRWLELFEKKHAAAMQPFLTAGRS